MVEQVAAAGLLTASSVMVVGLTFAFDRIQAPRERRAKGMLFAVMCIGYVSAVGCLYTVTLPNSEPSSLLSAEILFKLSTGSMVAFTMMMVTALFPDEVATFLN